MVSLLTLLALPASAGSTITVPGDFLTLADALAVANPGDVVSLRAGVHVAPTAPLEVSLVGDSLGQTIVVGELVIASSSVELRTLTLDGDGGRALSAAAAVLHLEDVVVEGGGTPLDGLEGGLVRLEQTTASFVDVELGPTNSGVDGGLLFADQSLLTLVDTSFSTGNGINGGALLARNGTLWMQGGSFASNDGVDGGAVYVDGGEATFVDLDFTANVASDDGGAIWAEGVLALERCSFVQNTAKGGAGAVVVEGDTADVVGGLFAFNTSTGAGAGAVLCRADACSVVDSVFDDNGGRDGGAVKFQGGAIASWERNTFCNNDAAGVFLEGNGGAVWSDVGGGRGEGNLYVRNSASLSGGGVSVSGDVELRHETFIENFAGTEGSALHSFFFEITLIDSLLSNQQATPAVGEFGASIVAATNYYSGNSDGNSMFPLEGSEIVGADPMLVDLTAAGCDPANYRPMPGSPLIDAGSGPDDADGSPSDIGAFGGPFAAEDFDGDGVDSSRDCDDSDASVAGPELLFDDLDGDGFGGRTATALGCGGVAMGGDCDDSHAGVFPGAAETVNGIDDDCDGLVDFGGGEVWYDDLDQDGFGDPDSGVFSVAQPPGMVADGTDCDDADSGRNPAESEVCDGSIDEDCDGLVDDADTDVLNTTTYYSDTDSDGFGDPLSPVEACVQPQGTQTTGTDCDDQDVLISDGITWYLDADGDGLFGTPTVACVQPPDSQSVADDCDDLDPLVGPESVFYRDNDLDGFGDGMAPVQDCVQPAGTLLTGTDCDDSDPEVGEGTTFFVDDDGDGFVGTSVVACVAPGGAGDVAEDCDDGDPGVSPGATEICDGVVDEDCDGLVDDDDDSVVGLAWFADRDGDGFGDAALEAAACLAPANHVADATDCDDLIQAVNPGAEEICDGSVDEDCDGLVDDADDSVVGQSEWFEDLDGDGFVGSSVLACKAPAGARAVAEDCDDLDAGRNPGAAEVCDEGGIDEDCDGLVNDADDSVEGLAVGYLDGDGDGYGAGDEPVGRCDPNAVAVNGSDCDDDDPAINPDASEVCSGVDEDCDELVDDDDPGLVGGTLRFPDVDNDGFGRMGVDGVYSCEAGVDDATDCDDDDPDRHPMVPEIADDGIDQNCDGSDLKYAYTNGCGCEVGASRLEFSLFWLGARRR